MKRIIIYTIALLLAVSACKVDYDYKFDDISTYRLGQYIEECDQMLINEEFGWKFVYYPEEETYGGYTFLMKFSKVNEGDEHGTRVLMESDLYIEPTGTIDPVPNQSISSYNYVVSLGPVLSFDTYSLLHFLSDPASNVYGGKAGVGYGGEFEFLITDVDAAEKKLSLLGKQYKREAVMVPATQEDWLSLDKQRDIMKDFKNDPTLSLFQYLVVDNTDTAFINYSSALRMAYLTYVKDGQTVAESYPVYSTPNGVKFKTSAKFGGIEFDELSFNTNTKLIQINNPEVEGRYTIFRTSDQAENFKLSLPGAVNLARTYADGFSMVERGIDLTNDGSADKMNIFPSGYSIQEFRFYWNLVGKVGAEVYIHPDGSAAATYARLYGYEMMPDNVGDQIRFIYINQSYYTGSVTDEINRWFGMTYSAPNLTDAQGPGGGPMHRYVTNIKKINGENINRGHTVIPVGKQFYMVQNGNNLAWALYTPLQVSRF
ncbi:DUF4302 domain-containing protein [Odoribacter sp. OttesenSCG-928-A06]|nr:DUF4302 domain-containing protein [Odoribacter sp. OttesenSCG-928-A06]